MWEAPTKQQQQQERQYEYSFKHTSSNAEQDVSMMRLTAFKSHVETNHIQKRMRKCKLPHLNSAHLFIQASYQYTISFVSLHATTLARRKQPLNMKIKNVFCLLIHNKRKQQTYGSSSTPVGVAPSTKSVDVRRRRLRSSSASPPNRR